MQPCASIDEVFRQVEAAHAGYGVVPVENSTEGSIGRTHDLLLATPLRICGEVLLPVHQCLMSKSGKPGSVKKILSHSQSLAQCHEWLNRRYAAARRVPVVSNAEAARLAARDASAAAIASKTAASVYKLKLIASNIEDEPQNTTRFIVISTHEAKPSRKDRTSIVFELKDRVGALHDILVPFKKARINMTKIESRPSRKKVWSYYFFVDFEGHHKNPRIAKALAAIEENCTFFKILGSHPKAEL